MIRSAQRTQKSIYQIVPTNKLTSVNHQKQIHKRVQRGITLEQDFPYIRVNANVTFHRSVQLSLSLRKNNILNFRCIIEHHPRLFFFRHFSSACFRFIVDFFCPSTFHFPFKIKNQPSRRLFLLRTRGNPKTLPKTNLQLSAKFSQGTKLDVPYFPAKIYSNASKKKVYSFLQNSFDKN